jgi:PPOX class probable F420-dependent enzyme
MDPRDAAEFIRANHNAVLATFRRDGRTQMSPVTAGVDEGGRVIISVTEDRAKTKNARRDPRVSLCVLNPRFYGEWVQVEGDAEVVPLPEAMDVLVSYYRDIAGEHPDWDEYRRAMVQERRCVIRFAITRAYAG